MTIDAASLCVTLATIVAVYFAFSGCIRRFNNPRVNVACDSHFEVNWSGAGRSFNLRDIADTNANRNLGLPAPWAGDRDLQYKTRRRAKRAEGKRS
ncbi:hypothetical protein BKA70DRAFT_1560982 [Coprinopsis sp. MPI-PUGE-AT-0042]|nr:hypothetical protein BKA70DRAFT_1560982 [Coprinopsis sp. MPI-PUGE-AT-0042]